MQSLAFFALLASASALESVDIMAKTSELLEKKLASFEHKNLKDIEVYEEYVKVREQAKKATAALEAAYQEQKAFTPVEVIDPSVKALSLDLEEADGISDWKIEAQQAQLQDEKQEEAEGEAEESEDTQRSPLLLAQEGEEEEEEESVTFPKEEKEEKKDEKTKVTKKKDLDRMARNLMTKSLDKSVSKNELAADAKEFHDAQAANLRNFQSPYREASKENKEQEEVAVVDEGKGSYGKFGDKILEGVSLLEEGPKLSLEDTMAKREEEMRLEAITHQRAIKLAKRAEELCGVDGHCKDLVQKKLNNGWYDRELIAKMDAQKKLNLKAKAKEGKLRQKVKGKKV